MVGQEFPTAFISVVLDEYNPEDWIGFHSHAAVRKQWITITCDESVVILYIVMETIKSMEGQYWRQQGLLIIK